MDDVPLCPEWWPKLLWRLHFPIHVPGEPPPNPVNYPPAIQDIMANLHIHTMSYLMLDQAAAKQVREVAETRMVETVKNLSRLHDQHVGQAA